MSGQYPYTKIIRCPLCNTCRTPDHVCNGVMLCETCGNYFRVLHGSGPLGSRKLTQRVKDRVDFAPQHGPTK